MNILNMSSLSYRSSHWNIFMYLALLKPKVPNIVSGSEKVQMKFLCHKISVVIYASNNDNKSESNNDNK